MFRLLAICTTVASALAVAIASPAQGDQPAPRCVVREVSSAPLLVDGNQQIYIEPTELARAGDRVLLAGTPNTFWARLPSGDYIPFESNRIFGVVMEPDGRTHTVPAPIEARRIADIRALGRGDGTWEVVFAEMDRAFDPPNPRTVVRFWYGILDGERWSSLETLPLPPASEGVLAGVNTPHPVRRGDTLTWATMVRRTALADVVVFQRFGGRWHHEVVRTRQVAYVQIAHVDSLGVVLAVLRPDSARGGTNNSLDLFARRHAWTMVKRLVYSGQAAMYDPRLLLSPSGGVLSWWARPPNPGGGRGGAQALLGPLDSHSKGAVTLDSMAVQSIPIPMDDAWLWVVDHGSSRDSERELRLLQPVGDSVEVLSRVPNPSTGYFAASGAPNGEVLVVSSVMDPTRKTPLSSTVLFRHRLECGGSTR